MKMGLATSSIAKNVITELINEDDLIFVLEDSKITISNENEETNTTEKINEDIDIDHNQGKKSILSSTKNDEKQFYRRKIKMKKLLKIYYLNVLLKLNDNEKSHYNLWKNKQKK
jgi:hypothetical protein